MGKLNPHWTEDSTSDLLYKIGADYVRQIERKIPGAVPTQAKLAARLDVSEGRVSQVLKHPGNITLRTIVEYARALGLKVAVIAYDDGDPKNFAGPINAEIFTSCWEMSGRPRDFFDLNEMRATADNTKFFESLTHRKEPATAYSTVFNPSESADNDPENRGPQIIYA
jgi:transcriptional regulator with XRE-family HTH domain